MLLISELIVYLWFVPVVLCILLPLVILCAWTVMQFAQKPFGEVEKIKMFGKKDGMDPMQQAYNLGLQFRRMSEH